MADGGLKALWARLTGRGSATRAAEWPTMTPAERSFANERIEDHQADYESEAHLGGGDPGREPDDAGRVPDE